MAGLPPQQTDKSEGFEFQVEHILQSESQPLALQQLEHLLSVERAWPGCLGTVGPDLIDVKTPNRFITRTQWKDVDCFVAWMVSRERIQLLQVMDGLGYSYSAETNWRGYASWIAGQAEGGDPPPTWKVNLLVLLCLYPTVLILNSLINPLGLGYSTSILLGNICSVALTGWLLVPAAQRCFERWMTGRSSRRNNQLSLLSIAALLLLSWMISSGLSG